MTGYAVAVLIICAGVLFEVFVPGQTIYHAAWYNLVLLALAVGVAVNAKRIAARVSARAAALTLSALGAAILALAGIANGLLAPDVATIVAAPGAVVHVADLDATLTFSLLGGGATLTRGSSSLMIPASGRRLVGSFVLRAVPRTDIAVAAYDAAGRHLTITQPDGSVFLSPVLTLQQRQPVSGVSLPFDTFAVPAAHRVVHVLLFDPGQAAALLRGFDNNGDAVLFAVDDEAGRPVAHGIAVARDGGTVVAGGLRLHAKTLSYPVIEILPVPMPAVLALGLLLVVLGALAAGHSRSSLQKT